MSGRNFRRRADKRNAEKFVMLPDNLLVRAEFASLPPPARVIYVEMAKLYRPPWGDRPGNNGNIWYGCRQGGSAANVSFGWAAAMLHRIADSGAASITSRTAFNKKDSHKAQEWELAIYPTHGAVPRWSGNRHLRLYNWMTEAPAYVALSSSTKCILWELMRRHDGNNNGIIGFGGQDGSYAKLSRDVTEKALTELECARFIVVTEPAIPHLKRPRKWRLTMYPADGKPATKDFMKAGSAPPQNSFHGELRAGDSSATVNPMRMSNLLSAAASSASINENPSISLAVPGRRNQSSHPRILHVEPPSHPRTVHTSIEAMSGTRTARAAAPCPAGQKTGSSLRPAMPHPLSEKQSGLQSQLEIAPGPGGLFGVALTEVPTPMERLRGDLREVLARRRGTQSRLADALRISRHTLSNAINRRERFSPTAAAALRRWLDGDPISEAWPPIPSGEEDAA
jgi:hypothetical protein